MCKSDLVKKIIRLHILDTQKAIGHLIRVFSWQLFFIEVEQEQEEKERERCGLNRRNLSENVCKTHRWLEVKSHLFMLRRWLNSKSHSTTCFDALFSLLFYLCRQVYETENISQ